MPSEFIPEGPMEFMGGIEFMGWPMPCEPCRPGPCECIGLFWDCIGLGLCECKGGMPRLGLGWSGTTVRKLASRVAKGPLAHGPCVAKGPELAKDPPWGPAVGPAVGGSVWGA
mmetsp:Transcript_78470/g.188148  ORF Transcript_78470/g.188148 Transcript_78470/m.188148 type:complete len:113 (-) Transcript_78470:133-471(-)